MISINNIQKYYGSQLVLQVESLSIAKGESIGLVGNNGAGKTTLFRLLLDLIKANQGTIQLQGMAVTATAEWKKFTGSYLDENFLIDFLTPEEYFLFVGQLHGMNQTDVDHFLLQHEGFFNNEVLQQRKYIRDLSKGNQKKVGIIAALMGDPDIVILDEPFANLDPRSQIQLKKLINDLDASKTVLISSHDLSHVTEVCHRIIVLEKGRVMKDLATTETTLRELEAYFTT